MKSRLLLYAFVVVVLGVFIVWFARNTYWDEVTIPIPLHGEALRNPFYSAQRLAESLGASTQWRKTLGDMPPTDAVLVLEAWQWGLIPQRREQIERWVEGGGRLVVNATFTPDRDNRFTQWSGVSDEVRVDKDAKRRAGMDEESDEDVADAAEESIAQRDDGCMHLSVTMSTTQPEVSAYLVCKVQPWNVLHSRAAPVWALAHDDQTKVLRVAIGKGSLTVMNAEPFGNLDLLAKDHGLLFAAVTQLRSGDLIVFASEQQRASILELIWNYGAPAVVLSILFLAAALWRNGASFGPPVAVVDGARRSLSEQIVGTGRFTLRVGGGRALHAAAVRALQEAAEKKIAGYARMSTDERIAHMARLAQADAESLSETMNYVGARRARELKHAVELLERVRRRLLA